MAANKTIGGINVTISATIDKFAKNITAARKMSNSFSSTLKGLVFNLKTLGAALAVGAMGKLVSDQFAAINSLKDLADKTGVSTDKLAGLQLAAEEAGVSSSVLEKGLVKLNNEMGMAGDKALRAWIDKTSKLTTQQEKLAAATEMFGSRGADMVRFLNGGTAALDEAQKAAEAMGLAITQDMAIGVDRASESFARLKMIATGIFRSMAAEMAPYIELLSTKAMDFVANNGGGSGVGKFIVDVMVEMSLQVVDLIQKMVIAGMEAFVGLQALVVQFRTGAAAGAMGLGYGTPKESFDAIAGLGKSYSAVEDFKKSSWSDGIRTKIDDFRKQSAEAAAKWASEQGSAGLFDGILGDAKKFGMGSLESWKGAGMGLWGAASGGFQKMAMEAGAMTPDKMGRAPALSFAESGSVESYRQQAAIRRQGDDIAKKQLGVQQQIRDGINNLADVINFPAANLGK